MTVHAMMPEATHDEAARFAHVVSLKNFLMRNLEPKWRGYVDEHLTPQFAAAGRDAAEEYRDLERRLAKLGAYRTWQALTVAAQEEMWRSVGQCVDRQLGDLDTRAKTIDGGSVRTDSAFVAPRYLSKVDIHLMPGGYAADRGGDDVRQGAVFDKAAALYHMGRNGGELNDVRGHTIVQHLFERYGNLRPKRILDIGCTVGHSTTAIASYFPDAEVHGIDVGGALLRYARARSASLGQKVHYSQQNGEQTDFPEGHFDLVVSSAVLHETSFSALPRIFKEAHRLLRPGGVMINLEVPLRFDTHSTWSRIRGLFEALHNNEPFWIGAQTLDVGAIAKSAGFAEVLAGYQNATPKADRAAAPTFTTKSGPVHVVWYMVSGVK